MENNNQQNLDTPQQPPVNPIPSPAKLNNKVIISIVVLIIIAVVAGYVALKWSKTNISPITTQTTGETQRVLNDVSKKIVGPLTIQPLMPMVEMDQPSISYKNSIIQIQPGNISEEIQKPLKDIILKSDLEIKSRNVDSLDSLFSILYTNSDKSFVLYVMTPTGTSCILPGEMGFSCDNAKLKILNTKDNSINLLTNNFGDIYLSEKDDSIIVFSGSKYEIFNLSKPYSIRESTPSGFSSLLINEYTISYNQKTSNLVIENILDNKKISCAITDIGVKNALKNNFDSFHFSLSPYGNKIILFEGDNKFFWNDISSQWSSNSPDCLNNAKEAELSGVKSVSRMGKWYANASYFAYSDYGDNTFVYNFVAQQQTSFMPWANTISVGYLNNSGYHDTASVDDKVSKVIVVPGEKQISIYFEMPDGKRYLVGSYSDKSSTQAFYQLTQQYPVNSAGDYTSGKLANAGVPSTWVRIEKDNTQKNLYHVLVLDGYNLRQVLDVSVAPTTGSDLQSISIPDMSKYTDSDFGFSFWYPTTWTVQSTATKDNYAGGTIQKTLTIAPSGTSGEAITIDEFSSPTREITIPKDLCSPMSGSSVPAHRYYFDVNAHTWMEEIPAYTDYSGKDGSQYSVPASTKAADVSSNTMGGLHMLSAGCSGSVIPLSAKNFVVFLFNSRDVGPYYINIAKTITATDASVATPVSSDEQIQTITNAGVMLGAIGTRVGEWYVTSDHVYNGRGDVVVGANPSTFKLIGTYSDGTTGTSYATDGVHVYSAWSYEAPVLYGADPSTFVAIRQQYQIPYAQSSGMYGQSFTAYDTQFAKDKSYVWYESKLVPGADPNTFVVTGNTHAQNSTGGYTLAHDARHTYGVDAKGNITVDGVTI